MNPVASELQAAYWGVFHKGTSKDRIRSPKLASEFFNQAGAITILKAFVPNLHGVEDEKLHFEAGNRVWPCIPILPREHFLQHSEIVIRNS